MQEVGGSIPPGSTSLRLLRKLRLGKPAVSYRSEAREGCRAEARSAKAGRQLLRLGRPSLKYVYILQSIDAEHFYVGITDDLRTRLAKHNAGGVPHTSKFKPWRVKTYIAFRDEIQAFEFEQYLKSPSGRAFARKRL